MVEKFVLIMQSMTDQGLQRDQDRALDRDLGLLRVIAVVDTNIGDIDLNLLQSQNQSQDQDHLLKARHLEEKIKRIQWHQRMIEALMDRKIQIDIKRKIQIDVQIQGEVAKKVNHQINLNETFCIVAEYLMLIFRLLNIYC